MSIFLITKEATAKLKEVYNRNPLFLLEHIFVVFFLIRYSLGILEVILTNGASEGDGQDILSFNYKPSVALYFLNYIVTNILLIMRWKKVIVMLMAAPTVVFLIAMFPVSFLWSIEPSKTLNASIAMIGTFQFGLYLATRYSLRDQVRILGVMFGISQVLCFVFGVALRKYGVMSAVHAGKWRGIYSHKNQLGKMMALASGVFVLLGISETYRRYRYLAWFGLITAFVLIQLSGSKSPFINIGLLIAMSAFGQIFRLPHKWMVRALIWSAVIGINLFFYWDDIVINILGALGKDASLTGRTDVWEFVIDRIKDRPILGYGFGTFWNGLDGKSAYVVRAVRWPVPDAHNGFLEICIDLGLVGLAIYIWVVFQTIIKTLALIRATKSNEYIWVLMFFTYSTVANLSESSLLFRNSLPSVIFAAVSFTVAANYYQQFKVNPPNFSTQIPEQPLPETAEFLSDESRVGIEYKSNS
ncbi:O-antigen ligase family protein [Limnothrix redekei]|uniref:O-antigen ligase n=1 Tax=Limnothrix redekei LRLZ20PSL1 TaxID=3112953 RepID=A0ABW7CFL6_9CYAN